jgi:hypothetical protein
MDELLSGTQTIYGFRNPISIGVKVPSLLMTGPITWQLDETF